MNRAILIVILGQLVTNFFVLFHLMNDQSGVSHTQQPQIQQAIVPQVASIDQTILDKYKVDQTQLDAYRQQKEALQNENLDLKSRLDNLETQIDRLQSQLYQNDDSGVAQPPPPVPITSTPGGVLVVIPTVPRQTKTDYLSRMINSMTISLSSALGYEIQVMNMRPGQHDVFRDLQRQFASDHFVTFAEIQPNLNDPLEPIGHVFKPGLTPHEQARQQTRDIVTILTHLSRTKTHEYILLMEDDFVMCRYALHTIAYAVSKANRLHDWNSIRFSFGLNGIVLKTKDLAPLADYLIANEWMMPVDLLVDEWLMNINPNARQYHGTRSSLFCKVNLFEHLGSISTFSDGRGERKGLKCGQQLKLVNSFVKGTLFLSQCGVAGFDLSPCGIFTDTMTAKEGLC